MRTDGSTVNVPIRLRTMRFEFARRWCRRTIAISAYLSTLIAGIVLFPFLITLAVIADGVLRRRFAAVRFLLFVLFFLAMELVGVAMAFMAWCMYRVVPVLDAPAFVQWNFRLQCWWGSTLANVGLRLFGMRLEVEDGYTFSDRPIILFLRHASFADTVIAVLLVSARHNIQLRYVLKRQLLWDPCLDIVGHRLQNYFVRRGQVSDSEAVAVGRLAHDLGPRDGILIYPEGTRFTEAKRTRILASLRDRTDAEVYDRAKSFTNVLPPHMGGTMALLNAHARADAVFCAHTGLEGSATVRDILNGAILGNTVHIKFWGVPYEKIPTARSEQMDWFYNEWGSVDQWVGMRKTD